MKSITENQPARLLWIDVAKMVAIIGVLFNHVGPVIYLPESVTYYSYYSVSLFIMLLGITTYGSLQRNKRSTGNLLFRKCWAIIRPFLVGSFIFVYYNDKMFDFLLWFKHLLAFDAFPQYYFVLLYLQLILISPLLYKLLTMELWGKKKIVFEILVFFILVYVSRVTSMKTNILDVYGGGGKLFGGTYLTLLYMGMWFAKYKEHLHISRFAAIPVFCISLGLSVACGMFVAYDKCFLDCYLPFGATINPPGLCLTVYALLVGTTVFSLDTLVSGFGGKLLTAIWNGFAYIGRHTLYIFLYHLFFIYVVFDYLARKFHFVISTNPWRGIVYFASMIFGSILIEYIFEAIHKFVASAYTKQE